MKFRLNTENLWKFLKGYLGITVETQEEYDELMEYLESLGLRWYGTKESPTSFEVFEVKEYGIDIYYSSFEGITWFYRGMDAVKFSKLKEELK